MRTLIAWLVYVALSWAVAVARVASADEPAGNQIGTHPTATGRDATPFVTAVVRDGPSEYFDELVRRIKAELERFPLRERPIAFREGEEYDAGWNISQVPAVMQKALRDPEVDLVLAAGVLMTEYCLRGTETLAKPVIAACFQDADTLGLPTDEAGHSTRPNLNFVVTPITMGDDLEAFRRLVPFERLQVLADRVILEAFSNEVARYVQMYGAQLGGRVDIVPVDDLAEPVLARLREDAARAVYITPLLRMPRSELRRLIDGLAGMGAASFSMMGRPEVEMGVLAGISPATMERLARRLALNIRQVATGASPNQLPTRMVLQEQLVVNAATAVRIGLELDPYALVEAEILRPELLERGEPLDLRRAVTFALENDARLQASRSRLAAAQATRGIAASSLLPDAQAQAAYTRVDRDRARASLGLLPYERSSAGFTLSQVIFDEGLISNLRAAGRLAEQRRLEAEATRLDVIAETLRRYLSLLEARASLSINRENLLLVRRNLELARLRQEVGSSGPEEVYRWESEEARSKSAVLDSLAAVRAAEVALNQAMGTAQERRWKPQDLILEEGQCGFLNGRLDQVLGTGERWPALQDLLVRMALTNSPELAALDRALEAARIARDHARRRFYTPSVSAAFTYDHELDASRPDSDVLEGGLPRQDDDDWTFSVQVSLPIFEGGGRYFELRRAEADVHRLEELRRDVQRLVERNVRSILAALSSSHANIGLSRLARDRARRNLEVVRRKYAAGDVSIIELLDAQNEALVQDRAAALAVYRYLRDLVELQRAVAWFEIEKSEKEQDEMAERILQVLSLSQPGQGGEM